MRQQVPIIAVSLYLACPDVGSPSLMLDPGFYVAAMRRLLRLQNREERQCQVGDLSVVERRHIRPKNGVMPVGAVVTHLCPIVRGLGSQAGVESATVAIRK